MSYLTPEKILSTPPKVIQLCLFGIAYAELGVKETPGSENNSRILEYHSATKLKASDDMTPWCSAFVNWVCLQLGAPKTNGANARSWLDWGEAIETPDVGDIVILNRGADAWTGHVGFVAEAPKHYDFNIKVLGGNQGDAVSVATYSKARVLGYRRFKV